MLVTIFSYGYIFYLSFTFGLLFYRTANFFRYATNLSDTIRIDFIVLTGVILLSVLCAVFHFFAPINFITTLPFNLLAIVYLFIDRLFIKSFLSRLRTVIQKNKIQTHTDWWLVGLFSFVVLLSAQAQAYNYDTGLYHAQAIKWIEQYPVVPGLGNLHERLAFNSHYFLICSFFNISHLGWGDFSVFTSFLILLFTLSCLYDIFTKNDNVYQLQSWILIFFTFFFYYKWMSSPSPDVIVSLSIWYILILFHKFYKTKEFLDHSSWQWLFCILCSVFLVTIKLSAIILLILPLYLLLKQPLALQKQKLLHIGAASVIGLIVLLPWLIRNVILSGYLVYPLVELDLFDVDWKVPEAMTTEIKDGIKMWGRIPWDVQGVERNPNMPLMAWFPIWLKAQPKVILEKGILIFILCYSFVFVFRKNSERVAELRVLWLTALAGIAFWFWSAPDFRFVHGMLIIGFLVCFISLLQFWDNRADQLDVFKNKWKKYFFVSIKLLLIAYCIVITLPVFFPKKDTYVLRTIEKLLPFSFPQNLLTPSAYPQNDEFKTVKKLGEHEIVVPVKTDQCGTLLLCRPQEKNTHNLELRGENLREGFRNKKSREKTDLSTF